MPANNSSTEGNPRSLRGLHIALNSTVKQTAKGWIVPSQSSSSRYVIPLDLSECTCRDYEEQQVPCKHIYAVMHTLDGLEDIDDEQHLDPPEARATYGQDWPAYNLAQTHEKAMFQTLLHDLCQNVTEPPRTVGAAPGGRKPLRMNDMLFSVVFKIYSTVSGRRFMTDLKEAHDKGYIKRTPHFNSLSNYLDKFELTHVLRELIVVTALPLKSVESDFAVDSSGISNNRFVKWFNVKHGRQLDYSDWIKLHLMCGTKTNIVTSQLVAKEAKV